jgi:uncharacterized protein
VLFRSLGITHKVLFGTDFPVFRLQGEQKNFVEVLTADNGALSELNQRERSLVLFQNIERLIGTAVAAAA